MHTCIYTLPADSCHTCLSHVTNMNGSQYTIEEQKPMESARTHTHTCAHTHMCTHTHTHTLTRATSRVSAFSLLQYLAVSCRVLQYVAVCCSVLQYVAVCCSVLQCVAVCCRVVQCGAVWCSACGRPSHKSDLWLYYVVK